MTRYRLVPTAEQETSLLENCRHARFVWNLAVEQHKHWQPGRRPAPGYGEQSRQLTEARADHEWLAAGSVTVQQQALQDFHQALSNFFAGTHGKPSWRKAGRHEGFRQVAVKANHVRKTNRCAGQVWVPKVGWVRFRWSRCPPGNIRSYRVTRDAAGRWHIAFAAVPTAIAAPGNGQTVGVDRGVVVSAALSTGDLFICPTPTVTEQRRLLRLQRRLARSRRGSGRRGRVRKAIARIRVRDRDRRRDWVEKTSTEIARRYDTIKVEDLRVPEMTRSARGTGPIPKRNVRSKAGLNRAILASGWGRLVTRLEQKARGRVERVSAAYTSQRCSSCGHVASESRESQAVFRCRACGHTGNADVNAAINIAAGPAVTARGGHRVAGPVNREPQLTPFVT